MEKLCAKGRHHWVSLRCVAIIAAALPGTAEATEISSFQAGNGAWHLGTLAVGNVDADSQQEIVVPYRDTSGQWYLDAFKYNGSRLNGFPYASGSAEINVSPTLYDLDGDGRDEIIFTRGTSVIALRGNGSLFWSNAVTRMNYVPNGGFMTVTNGFYWSGSGGFIANLPTTAVFSSQVCSPMVADIDDDGTKEIVTAWKIDPGGTGGNQDFNPFINDIWGSGEWGTMGEAWSGGVVLFNAATGAKDFVYHIHQLVESGVALGQADSDPPLEVYVLNDSDSVVCFDKTKPHGLHGNGMLHKQFGKNQRLLSGAYEQGVDVYTADIDGDGLAEVLVPTTHLNPLWQPNETILDDDGAILWREWHQPVNYTLNQWQNNACMIPLNPDHDNHIDVLSYTHSYEIAFRYWNGAELVSHPGWPKSFYPSLPTPPVVGDVDGDGAEEIVIGTYNPETNPSSGSLYVFGLDGTLRTSVAVPGGLKHVPTLADANGDGSLDVVYRSLAGRIYIQNFGANNPGAVSWSTHRGNARRDGYFNASLFPSGTPLITRREGGYRRANFAWGGAATNSATAWRIFRAERPEGPFVHVATLTAGATSCTDEYLKPGWQYFYEVRAVYGTNEVASAPFAVLSSVNSNLVSNGGFEENDNSHWDKWFTGDISWTNMIASTNGYEGGQCMEVKLINNGNNGSISQYGQYGTPDGSLPVTPGQLYSFGGFLKSAGISKPSEHWFEWSSTKTAEFTNDRPPRPYPLYFTPHFIIGTTATDWTYANRTFVMPAGFPNIELTHRYSINTPGSGRICMDNVFFRALPSPGATNWTSLIPFGGDWRYSTVTPPGNWYLADFNDLIWPSGTAKFGAGSGPTNILTLLPPLQAKYYFRRTFMAPAGSVEELLLSATCTEPDKPMEIYLNGVRLPTTGVDAVTSQGNEVQYYDLAPFIGLLRPGTNTIAVALHNSWSSWDDVAFDLSLKAITYQPLQARFISIDRSPSVPGKIDLGVSTPADSIWRIESCDNIAAPYWQFVETITNNSGASLFVSDTGQNGRPSPRSVSNRLYRMVPQ